MNFMATRTLLDATPRAKSTVGRCCDVEWPIRESVVQNYGSSGLEQWRIRHWQQLSGPQLEVWGLQSVLNDFCLRGHVAIRSDATAAIGMVHRLGSGNVRHFTVGDLWVQHHARSGNIRVSKMSGLENPSDAQTKCLGLEPLLGAHENVQLGTCRLRVVIDSKVGQEGLFC